MTQNNVTEKEGFTMKEESQEVIGNEEAKPIEAEERQLAADVPRPLSGSSATPAYSIDQLVLDRVIRQVRIVFHPHFFEDAGSISADGLY